MNDVPLDKDGNPIPNPYASINLEEESKIAEREVSQ